jgi:hypothetical protein
MLILKHQKSKASHPRPELTYLCPLRFKSNSLPPNHYFEMENSDDFSDELDEFEESQDDANMKKKVKDL